MEYPNADRVEIQLTQGQVAVVSSEDADLAARKWLAMKTRETYYAAHIVKHKPIYLHRVVLERKLGRSLTKGERCDHKDLNPLNNTRDNLRLASTLQNNRNSGLKRSNTSGYKGVHWEKRTEKWVAKITVNYKSRHLGSFDSPKEAHEAYCKAAAELHGEFARFE